MNATPDNARRVPTTVLVVLGIAFLVVLVVFGRFCSSAATINVTVNGAPLTLHGAKTMETAIRESGLPINPGDLISLKGTVLKRSAGHPFYATVNGDETTDPDRALNNGDQITVADGKDIVEDYDVDVQVYPHSSRIGGTGPICLFEAGTDGVIEQRTGKISGDVTKHIVSEETPSTGMWYKPDVGDDKVIALTFDEGPTAAYTSDILNILTENDARATFFFVGENAEEHPDLVQRAWGLYNQLGTNSYDREITEDTPGEEVLRQVEDGFRAISDALGDGSEPSRIVRLPDGLLTSSMAAAIDDDVSAVIGWDLDTGDWMETNSGEVYEVLLSARPGDIILMRDGGGNRSGTIAALRRALPELKKKGFSFITIDELMKYPAKES